MSSLRDRARQAAREERARQNRSGPTETGLAIAGALGELLECEVDPLGCEVRWRGTDGASVLAFATVDEVCFRVLLEVSPQFSVKVYEVQAGKGALRRWVQFRSLAQLDVLLD